MSCAIFRFLQESDLFLECLYEFKAPFPYESITIKVTLRDFHYILLLEHVNDVIKGIDQFETISPATSLRYLVLALLGFQDKPFRIRIPTPDANIFQQTVEKLIAGWMAIYQTSALSPCQDSATVSLISEVLRVKWSRVDLNECVVRYKHTCQEVFDISVHNDSCGSNIYLFHLKPSALFLFERFGIVYK